jgi:hypothetical protein
MSAQTTSYKLADQPGWAAADGKSRDIDGVDSFAEEQKEEN